MTLVNNTVSKNCKWEIQSVVVLRRLSLRLLVLPLSLLRGTLAVANPRTVKNTPVMSSNSGDRSLSEYSPNSSFTLWFTMKNSIMDCTMTACGYSSEFSWWWFSAPARANKNCLLISIGPRNCSSSAMHQTWPQNLNSLSCRVFPITEVSPLDTLKSFACTFSSDLPRWIDERYSTGFAGQCSISGQHVCWMLSYFLEEDVRTSCALDHLPILTSLM